MRAAALPVACSDSRFKPLGSPGAWPESVRVDESIVAWRPARLGPGDGATDAAARYPERPARRVARPRACRRCRTDSRLAPRPRPDCRTATTRPTSIRRSTTSAPSRTCRWSRQTRLTLDDRSACWQPRSRRGVALAQGRIRHGRRHRGGWGDSGRVSWGASQGSGGRVDGRARCRLSWGVRRGVGWGDRRRLSGRPGRCRRRRVGGGIRQRTGGSCSRRSIGKLNDEGIPETQPRYVDVAAAVDRNGITDVDIAAAEKGVPDERRRCQLGGKRIVQSRVSTHRTTPRGGAVPDHVDVAAAIYGNAVTIVVAAAPKKGVPDQRSVRCQLSRQARRIQQCRH